MNIRAVHLMNRVIDTVFPPQGLPGMPHIYPGDATRAWDDIAFLDEPCCHQCGTPFAYDTPLKSVCGDCAKRPPKFDRARAAMAYTPESRGLVLAFKHGNQTEGLPVFAQHMKRAGRRFWEKTDIILPVPLHPSRLIARRYNQAMLLARAVSRITHIPVRSDILLRTRATESQGRQSSRGRFRNVQGAFAVRDKTQTNIIGKRIVIIDDVFTTGATLSACAGALKRAKASHIDCVTLARTTKEVT